MPSLSHNIDAYVSGLPVPKFPTSVADTSALLVQKNRDNSQTLPSLASPIAPGDSSFIVAAGTGLQLPGGNFVVTIDNEIIFVASRTGDVCTVGIRGFEGTTPASHLAGVTVNEFITALSHNQSAAEINAIENYLAKSLAVQFSPFLPNLKILSFQSRTSSTGNMDLYTVPAGRRALIVTAFVYNNSGSTMSLVHLSVRVSGTYFQITGNTNSFTSNSSRFITPPGNYVAEAGEVIAINLPAQPVSVWLLVFEFDNTSPFKSPKVFTPLGIATGLNTLYTVPLGKTALISTATSFNFAQFVMLIANGSLAGRTYTTYQVPNGSSADATTQTTVPSIVGPLSALISGQGPSILNSQDSLVFNVDSNQPDQLVWTTVIELG